MTTQPRPRTPQRPTREPYAFVHVNKCAGSSIEVALGIPKYHATALEMRTSLGPDTWAARLSFAVVRHPVDRAAAIYFHRRRIGIGGLDIKPLSAEDWVRAVFRDRDPLYNEGTVYLAPSASWVCDGDRLIVDEILRFETLAQDWARLARRLSVCPVLPYLNVNPHQPWQEALSPAAQRLVADAWIADIDQLGYQI